MTTLFVTASGTDVGKTFVTLRLIDELSAAGYRVRALKPVASGFDAANPAASDTGALLRAQDLEFTRSQSRRREPVAIRRAAVARHGGRARRTRPCHSMSWSRSVASRAPWTSR